MGTSHHRTCHLCEASCGIRLTVDDSGRIGDVRGDPDDPFSRGYVCPKVMALVDIHGDPDRLRTPRVRRGHSWHDISWDDAFALVADRLGEIRKRHGKDALAVYQGNPTAHNFGLLTYGQLLLRTLGTRNMYSATSADQLPHMLSSLLMFGHQLLLPVPDVDRTDYFLVLGANPVVSGGSLMTAPDMKRRVRALADRGGRMVVVDPRRTETARLADRHLFIRPGTDALWLLSLIEALHQQGSIDLGRLGGCARGLARIIEIAQQFPAERTSALTGISADQTRCIAQELAAAPSAAVYGRVGVCTQEFGALSSWLINLVNIVTGNLDRPGGVMFSTPPVDLLRLARVLGATGSYDRYRSRVRGLPEFGGELPVSCLAEEIDSPGPGQIRALITSAGNPVLSAPNGARLERALAGLDFMVSIDFYVNETTRHADVILPPTFALERDHFELAAFAVSVRNGARYAPALFERSAEQRHDWEICLELWSRMGLGPGPVAKLVGPLARRLGTRLGPRGVAALGVGLGPYRKRKLRFRDIESAEHGVDLGPLEPCLPGALATEDRQIDLAPDRLVADVDRLRRRYLDSAELGRGLVLIGRRQLRSNNSWLHNSHRLVKGKPRCTLLVHPDDARRLSLATGDKARISSRTGQATVTVEVSDEVMRGVVSLPHGWGHGRTGTQLAVANQHAGVSINDLTDETFYDQLSGTAGFSGVPVEVQLA